MTTLDPDTASQCLGCGVKDNEPKHQTVHAGPEGFYSTFWHHVCHAGITPPCDVCVSVLSQVGE